MRLIFVLLSPTMGMHQYTADIANRFAEQGNDVHLVTTRLVPRDRYLSKVCIHDPIFVSDKGISLQVLRFWLIFRVLRAIIRLKPDLVHFTGPHMWNPLLLNALRLAGVPTIHTLHDLHPHAGVVYGRLLYVWNEWVQRAADHLLVHGQRYRNELLDRRIDPSRVTYSPLTHLFLAHNLEKQLVESPPCIRYESWALFFARLEKYKGLDVLLEAVRLAIKENGGINIIIAGKSASAQKLLDSVPSNIEVRNRYIEDEEALDLFCRCGLVILPYIEASQSALIAAAYFFLKPVVVTQTGALPEYVEDGKTGWVIPPQNPNILKRVLQTALDDPEKLESMGKNGRKWFDSHRLEETEILQVMYNRVLQVKRG